MVITSDSAALKAGLKTDSPKCVGKEGPGKENGRGEIERRSGRREGGRERDRQTDRQNDSSRSGKLVWASRVCPRKPCTEPHALGAFQQSVHRFLPFSKPPPPISQVYMVSLILVLTGDQPIPATATAPPVVTVF